MTQFNIKVIGVGGSGGNIINHMINQGVKNVDLIVAGTDKHKLDKSSASHKIQLGINLLNGQGAAMEPWEGRKAAIESFKEIKTVLDGAYMVIVVTGLGGGTGTGASPIIAQAAKEVGALTVSIVTSPFKFEGRKRSKRAKEGLVELKRESDATIIFSNEIILSRCEKNLGIKETFRMIDDNITEAVSGILKINFSAGEIYV